MKSNPSAKKVSAFSKSAIALLLPVMLVLSGCKLQATNMDRFNRMKAVLTGTASSAKTLQITLLPTSTVAGTSLSLQVTAKNAAGATATDYLGTVHFTSTDLQGVVPADYTFGSSDAGTKSFTSSVVLKTVGTRNVLAADASISSITDTQWVIVSAAATSQLGVAGMANPATAGNAGAVTVTATDAYGNLTIGYLGTIHFTSNDPLAVLPVDYTFLAGDNGAKILPLTLETAGAGRTITATDTGTPAILGTQASITVVPAIASTLIVSAFPSSQVAGVSGTVTVTAKDIYGNTATGYSGIVHFTSNDGIATLPVDYTFLAGDSGIHSFTVTLKTVGAVRNIIATDTVTGTITGTQTPINVTPAPASLLAFTIQPSGAATAGSNFGTQPTVSAKDSLGNVDAAYVTAVTLAAYTDAACTVAATGTLSGSATTTAGVAPFAGVKFTNAGTIYLKASSGALTPACSSAIAVGPAAATHLTFTGQPSATATAGSSFATQPIVVAQDGNANTDTAYATVVTLSAFTDAACTAAVGSGVLSGSATTAAGVAPFAGVQFTKSGTIYLKATSGALTTTCSNAIAVGPAAATQLAFSTQPSATATAGSNFATQPSVTARDANANTDTAYVAAITLSAYTDAGCTAAATGTLSGSATTAAGVAPFAGVQFTKSGTIYLKATSGAVSTACSSAIVVSAAAATKLAFTTQPASSANTAVNFITQPVVAAQDGNSNTDTSYATVVTLAAFTDAACTVAAGGSLSGAAATGSGVAPFAGVQYSAPAAIYLKATSGALTTTCSSSVTVGAASATKLAFTTQPAATATAGTNFTTQPVVAAQDGSNTTDPSYSTAITLTAFTNAACTTAVGSGVLSGSATTTAGVAAFAGVNFTKSGTIYLKGTSGGLATTCSSAIVVSAGAATQLAFTTQPSATATAATNFTVQPTVSAQDGNGNTNTSYATVVTLAAYTDVGCTAAATGTLSGSATTASGVAPFAGVNFTNAGTIYLKATSGALSTACAAATVVNPASASKLAFTGQPSATGTAGSSLATQPTVIAQDTSSNTDTAYVTAVTLSAYTNAACTTAVGSGVLSGSATTTAGVAAFSAVSFTKSGTIYLKATSGALTPACSSAIVLSAAAATTLAFTTQPSATGTAGTNLTVQPTVTAQDGNSNADTAYATAVTLTAFTNAACTTAVGSGVLSGAATTASGVAPFAGVNFTKSGTIYLKATSGALSTACSSAIVLSGAAATQLAFTSQPSATGTAGTNLTVQPTVTAQDGNANTDTAYATAVTLSAFTNAACSTAVGSGVLSGAATTANGVAPFAGVNFTKSGTIYLKATSGALTTACSSAIVLSGAAATTLAFTTQPSATGTAGTNLTAQPTVTAQDGNANTDTAYATAVTLSAFTNVACTTAVVSGVLSGAATTASGVAPFAGVNFTKSGTIYLKATSGALTTACSSAIVLSPGTATQLAFTTQPSATGNSGVNYSTQPTVTAQDGNANADTTYATAITLTAFTNAACTTGAGGTLSGSATTASGVAPFAGVQYSAPATIYLKATSGALTTACSSATVLTASAATHLAFSTQPSATGTAGSNFATQPVVQAQDGANAVDTSYATAVTLSAFTNVACTTAVGSGVLSGAATTASGVAPFAGVNFTKSGTIYLKATSGALTTACSSAIVISAAAATQLAFTTQPSATGTAGTNLTAQPTVTAQDGNANTDTAYATAVTLSAFTNVACTTAVGSGVLSGAATTASGVAPFAGVNFTKSGTIYLKATSGALTTACSSAIVLSGAAATTLAFTTQPSATGTAGTNLTAQPTVTAQDGNANTDTAYATAVTLSAFTNAACSTAVGSGVLSGAATTASGVAPFAGVNFTKSGTIYLKATSGALTTACSSAIVLSGAAATTLAFTSQPSATGTAGTNLTAQPTVTAQDGNANTDTAYATAVTLSAFTNVACTTAVVSGVLSGAATTASGVAPFAGVNFTKSGTIYLKATSGALTTACSSAIVLSGAAATTLAFTSQPSATGTAGTNLTAQPTVTAQDGNANTDTAYATAVTLSAFTNVACTTAVVSGVLSGAATTASGVAPFAGVNFTKSGTIYLKATSGALTTACSSAIVLSGAAATTLAFTSQPSATGTAGTNLTAQPTVTAQDGNANTDTAYATAVTLSAFTNVACTTAVVSGVLSGAATTASGVAPFAGVNFTKSGTIYLKATSGALTTACSSAIVLSGAAATTLAFTSQPSATGTAGTNLTAQPTVTAQDGNANTDTAYATAVTLSAFTNVACTTAVGSGVLSGAATTASGVAPFAGVNFAASGTIYLKATSGALTTACSTAIAVAAGAATHLTFNIQPASTATAGIGFSTQVVTAILDSSNNYDTAYATTITLTAFTDVGCTVAAIGTLNSNTIAPAGNGGAYFAGTNYTKTGTIYLKATSGALTATCSTAIVVSPGAMDLAQSMVAVASGTVPNAQTDAITVTAKDSYGNQLAAGGLTVVVSFAAGGTSTGNFGAVTDNLNGTYSSTFTATGVGTLKTLAATIIGGGSITSAMPTIIVTGMNLEVPIELLDYGVDSDTTITTFNRSRTTLDTTFYDGTVTYTLEIVAVNVDPGNSYNVSLVDSAGTNIMTFSIPAGTTAPTRYSAAITPTAGANNYRIKTAATIARSNVTVYTARIRVKQVNASKTRIYIPLLAKSDGSSVWGDDYDGPVSSTAPAGGWTKDPTELKSYSLWKKDASQFSAISSWQFEAVLMSPLAGTDTVTAALWDATTGLEVTASEISSTVQSHTLVSSLPFLSSAANFIDLDNFEARIKCSSTGNCLIGRAALWVTLTSLSKAEVYNRISKPTYWNNGPSLFQRMMIDTSFYSNPTSYFEVVGYQETAGMMSVDLGTAGVNDFGGGYTLIGSSTISQPLATRTRGRTGALSLTNGDRYIPVYNLGSGTNSICSTTLIIDTHN